jgi:pimeloyl-ACP methyl ester carboxylesterase
MEKFIAPFRGSNYAEAAGKFIDGITRPINDEATRDKIKTAMLRTPQYVAVSEFEATLDPELWRPDKINVPVLMILAKQPAWTPDYEKFARELAPDLDYQMWEGVSHFIMLDKPAEFSAALVAFLEKHGLTKN